MALDPVPWFVGAGARHSAAAARNLAWNATGGNTGVATPTSMQVRQTSTPGGNVQIMPGGCVIESTYQGALQQSYTMRNASATNVAIPPNTTSSNRTHYVTAEVNDPTYAGSNPPSVEDGPYNAFRVRSSRQSVHPEHLLAKIVVPPNTSVITDAMIEDMRELANPREKTIVAPRPLITSDNGLTLSSTSEYPDGEWFPNSGGNDNTGRYTIDVPPWATHMQIRCEWLGVVMEDNPGYGWYWVSFGPNGGSNDPTWYTQGFGWNSTNGTYLTNWILEQEVRVRPEWQGTRQNFYPRANFIEKKSGGRVYLNSRGGMVFQVRFKELPYMEELA